jgi:hypothetical protein
LTYRDELLLDARRSEFARDGLDARGDGHRLDIADRRHTDARTTRQKLLSCADIAGHSPARLPIADVRRKEFEEAHRGALAGDSDERQESVCAANPDTIAHGRAR